MLLMAPHTQNHQPLVADQTHVHDQSPQTSTTYSHKSLYLLLSFLALICLPTSHSLSFLSNVYDLAEKPSSTLVSVTDSLKGEQRVGLTDLEIFLEKSVSSISDTIELVNGFHDRSNDLKEQEAFATCIELMHSSIDRVTDSVIALKTQTTRSHADAHSWLSAVLTNHVTCQDELTESKITESTHHSIEMELENLIERAKTSLAKITSIAPPNYEEKSWLKNVRFPSWVTFSDRKLLEALPESVKANVVVAKDGSGDFSSVQEAILAAPNKIKTRYVIYVKKGVYKENVEVGKKKINLMIVGDGMDSTIITGSLNVVDGSSTFRSATVVVVGDGFIGQDICFQNTAGPQKHQAVALRVGADKTVMNRVKMDAYQDTLYAHSLRQFYRDCSIIGTVDFIFGNAAMVAQNSKIIARRPMDNQGNMCTAQGRIDPNQNTGFSIQNCQVIPSLDLIPVENKIKTYLGRPWKEYSRTVYMESFMDNHIDPAGWAKWNGDFALNTLYYGEYLNRGPGAGTANRVQWAGYHIITSPAVAEQFTVAELIQGGMWLKSTGVSFTEGL